MTKKLLVSVLALALASFALAACGGDDDDSTSAEGETTSSSTTESGGSTASSGGSSAAGGELSVTSSEGISYDESELSTAAGESTLTFTNDSSIPHDVVIEDEGGGEIASTEVITSGSAEATAELEPGTYTFFCSVDSHRDQGMEGTLTVE